MTHRAHEPEQQPSVPVSDDMPPDGVALDGTPVEQLQQERAERLAPENRPECAEVDNTGRDFDVEKGMFTDDPEYDQAPRKYPPLGEGGA